MASSNAVWGIDIGQCALKALRCTPHDEPGKVVADAFDFIEYPKILSQPEADPVELVRDALTQFLSRNKVRGDRVAISVPGQSGLTRFIKLPPVESKKIPDIVRYEARQQIPFALEDVVWDYQQMAGGSEEDGYALETEVGLFAMKRDQAARALRPFTEAGIEVDILQLTPLAIYNYVVFDQLQDLPPIDQYDPTDPPPSVIVVSLGTDTTDLVVTNGYRVWQRNIPLGGNHFTKALTKELKLTFTKAEHLKRNAMKAEDPKAVFLAMRPVFGDLVTEVQRSISFFQSVDRNAKISRVVTLGNAMKLRGLQKYVAQSLGYDVIDLEEYRGLTGASVVGAPSFRENLRSFAVCYGLCLQGLKESQLRTNLIPRDILQDRLVRSKKPWAVGAVAAILLGCCVGFSGNWWAYHSADDQGESAYSQSLKRAVSEATSVKGKADDWSTAFTTAKSNFDSVKALGEQLSSMQPRRIMWIELLDAISDALPRDAAPASVAGIPVPEQLKASLLKSKRIEIDHLDCERFSELGDWFTDVKSAYRVPKGVVVDSTPAAPAVVSTPNASPAPSTQPAPVAQPAPSNQPGSLFMTSQPSGTQSTATPDANAGGGPTGEGWVIQITGHTYHTVDTDPDDVGEEYIRRHFLTPLMTETISLPDEHGKSVALKPRDLGISFPVLFPVNRPTQETIPIPGAAAGGQSRFADPSAAQTVTVDRYDFIIQFAWKETPLDKRMEKAENPNGVEASKPPASAGP